MFFCKEYISYIDWIGSGMVMESNKFIIEKVWNVGEGRFATYAVALFYLSKATPRSTTIIPASSPSTPVPTTPQPPPSSPGGRVVRAERILYLEPIITLFLIYKQNMIF